LASRLISLDRRRLLARALALSAAPTLSRVAAAAAIVNPPALLENEAGGYRILPAGTVFCGGAIPVSGHEIVHALVSPWVPLKDGYGFIQSYLKSIGRPVQALCGMELRSPQQMTFEAFRAFNAPYIEQLTKWDLMLGRYSAVCRTNVVPARDAPKEPSLHAFSYCVPSNYQGITFCISGTADIDQRGKVVAEGDVSPAGMKQRLQYCVDVITERLAELEVLTPLLELEQWQVVEVGFQVGAPFDRTWSCHEESSEPCWACRGCRAREAAFTQSGKADPMRVVRKL